MRPMFVVFSLSVLITGCSDSGSEVVIGPKAFTAKTSYDLGDLISVTITGDKRQTVWLQTCCSLELMYYIDRFESGEWVQYEAHDIPCMRACAWGGVYVDPSTPYHIDIGSDIQEIGTYRFRFLFNVDGVGAGFTDLATNSFRIG